MANHNSCAVNLTGEIAELIRNEEEKLKNSNLSEFERMRYLQDVVRKLKQEEKLEILQRAETFKALKSKLDEAVSTYSNKWFKVSYQDALLNIIQTNTKSSQGARLNLEQTIISLHKKHLGYLSAELNKIDHFRIKGDIDITTKEGATLNNNIMRERAKLNGADIESTGDPIALQYAKALNEAQAKLDKDLTLANFNVSRKKGFAGMQTHSKRILQEEGFETWHKNLFENVNLAEQPFLKSKAISNNIYKYLVGDIDNMPLADVPISMKQSVKDFIQNENFIFKDIEAEINYANTFGSKISETYKLGASIDRQSKTIAEKNFFGTTPRALLNDLIDYANSKSSKSVNRKKIYSVYNEVMGKLEIGNESVARAGANVRKLTQTTIFGGTMINSPIPDRINRAFLEFSTNGGYGELLFNLTKAIPQGTSDIGEVLLKGIDFKRKGGLTQEETIHLNNLGIGAESFLSYANRFYDEINALGSGEGFSKFVDGTSKMFSKVSGLEVMDNLQTKGVLSVLAKDTYFSLNKKNWKGLETGERLKLTRYGITEQDYNVLSKLLNQIEDDPVFKEKIFDPNYIKNLTKEDLQEYIAPLVRQASDLAKITGTAFNEKDLNKIVEKVKFDLETKIRTFYNGETHIALGKRDSRANFFSRGTKAGTFGGEATRFFAQAKTYPMLYLDNIVKNIYYSTAIETNEKWAGFVAFASACILAGYLIEQLTEIRNNKTPKDFDSEMAVRSVVRSGIFGLWGDALVAFGSNVFDISKTTGYQNQAQLYKEVAGFLGGPTISKGLDILEGVNNLLAKKPNADKLLKSIKSAIPMNNLFYINGILNYLTMAISEGVGGKGLTTERKRLRGSDGFFADTSRELIFDPLL